MRANLNNIQLQESQRYIEGHTVSHLFPNRLEYSLFNRMQWHVPHGKGPRDLVAAAKMNGFTGQHTSDRKCADVD